MSSEDKKQLIRRWVGAWLFGAVPLLMAAVWLGFRAGSPVLIRATPRLASRLFEGFSYVGRDLPNAPLGVHTRSFLPLRLEASDLPEQFLAGHDYFFHHPLPGDGGTQVAEELLVPRLRKEGFVLTEGSEMDRIFYRGPISLDYEGGGGITIWSIQFKRGSCGGVVSYDSDFGIRNNPWPLIRQTWDPADYILKIDAPCDL